jgi:hypothetical protein
MNRYLFNDWLLRTSIADNVKEHHALLSLAVRVSPTAADRLTFRIVRVSPTGKSVPTV